MTASLEKLRANVEIIMPKDGLEQKLAYSAKTGKKLVVKLGFDPTAPDLHLGHAVVLKKLRDFQEEGHKIVVIVGDFTALIGDPTGRNKTRPPLSPEEVAHNAETYIKQLSKILDINKIEIRPNREWLGKLTFEDLLKVTSKVTVSQIMQRNDFSERYENNTPISLHEMLYPIMQALDSVEINADVELGGTDQMFNCLMGRQLQEAYEKHGQIVMCMPILPGTDGVEKMSKSKNNYIGLTENANDMFGKVMSIPDALLKDYLELATEFPAAEKKAHFNELAAGTANPMELKKKIAADIVRQYHGADAATSASQHFYNQVQNRSLDAKEYQEIKIATLSLGNSDTVTLLVLCKGIETDKSNKALRDLIEGGGVSVNGEKTVDPFANINIRQEPVSLKLGKRGFYRLIPG